jgi:hypothetical protein
MADIQNIINIWGFTPVNPLKFTEQLVYMNANLSLYLLDDYFARQEKVDAVLALPRIRAVAIMLLAGSSYLPDGRGFLGVAADRSGRALRSYCTGLRPGARTEAPDVAGIRCNP